LTASKNALSKKTANVRSSELMLQPWSLSIMCSDMLEDNVVKFYGLRFSNVAPISAQLFTLTVFT